MRRKDFKLIYLLLGGLVAFGFLLARMSERQESMSDIFQAPSARIAKTLQNKTEVSVMTFNVQNLFDTKDDPGKNDETFLPLEMKGSAVKKKCERIERKGWRIQCLTWNWSDVVLKQKMLALTKAISQVDGGKGPDILILQEVENLEVLELWQSQFLTGFGYHEVILVEGRDIRGIDVAILSKLRKLGKPELHYIPFEGMSGKQKRDSRGILEVAFELPDQSEMTVYGVHLPAPFHPAKYRIQGFKHLTKLAKRYPKSRLQLAAGDFNVPSEEDSEQNILKQFVEDDWQVAHKQCSGDCRGTSYYPPKNSWSFLDMILVSKPSAGPEKTAEETAHWKIKEGSVKVLNTSKEQVTRKGTPKFFSPKSGLGTSDHWPLGLTLTSQ